MQNKFDAAIEYHRQELQVIPLKAGEKTPALKPAYDRPFFTLPEYENYFYEKDFNIGVVCGLASKGFFVVDIDDRKQYKKFKSEIDSLVKTGAPVVETRRGYHIWTRCPELTNRTFDKIPGIDFKIKGHVVVPPSLLETGQLYLFREELKEIPVLELEQIPFKSREKIIPGTDLIRVETGLCFSASERPHGIPIQLFQTLHGSKGKYYSRSEADQALIVYCVNNGWTFENIKRLFDVHATDDNKYREKEKNGYSYLKTNYENALEYLENNRTPIDKQIDALSSWADNKANWKGRTALTDQAVFQSMLCIARRTGKLSDIYASCREISEAAGIGKSTASNALERIPFLKLMRKDIDSFTPAVWTIETPKQILSSVPKRDIPTHSPPLSIKNNDLELNHDLFRLHGIGKNGRFILASLNSKEWRTLKEIIALTNFPRRTVHRKLERMQAVGLIEIKAHLNGRLFRRIDKPDYGKAAELLGTAGKLARQKAKHRLEREAYRKAFETKESLTAI